MRRGPGPAPQPQPSLSERWLKTGLRARGSVCVLLWEKSALVLPAVVGAAPPPHALAQEGWGRIKWEGGGRGLDPP